MFIVNSAVGHTYVCAYIHIYILGVFIYFSSPSQEQDYTIRIGQTNSFTTLTVHFAPINSNIGTLF